MADQHLGGEIRAELAEPVAIFRALLQIGESPLPAAAQSFDRLPSTQNFSHSRSAKSRPAPLRASRIRNSRSSVRRSVAQNPPTASAAARRTVMLVASTGIRSAISAHSNAGAGASVTARDTRLARRGAVEFHAPTTGRRPNRCRPQKRRAAPPAGPADRHRRNPETPRTRRRAASSPRLRAPLGPRLRSAAITRMRGSVNVARYARGSVGRCVVDHDQLEARALLREHARDRAPQMVLAIVGRKHDGDVGRPSKPELPGARQERAPAL